MIPSRAGETKQSSFSRHELHINTAARSTGMLITGARCVFCPCNIWTVCLSYTEPDMDSVKSRWKCVCMHEYPAIPSECIYDYVWRGGISALAEEEEDDECILHCWNTNQACWGNRFRDGTHQSPHMGQGGFKSGLMVIDTVAHTAFKLRKGKYHLQ